MLLQIINLYRDKIYFIKGQFLKLFLLSKQVDIGNLLKISSFPKITLLGKYTLKIGNNVSMGNNVDIRVYDNSILIIDDNSKIDDGVRIIAANGNTVYIKKNTKIGFYSILNGGGGIEIGPNSSTYGFVYLQSSTHETNKDLGFSKEKYVHAKINIGKSVLIGSHSVIMPGCTIKDNTNIESHKVMKYVKN